MSSRLLVLLLLICSTLTFAQQPVPASSKFVPPVSQDSAKSVPGGNVAASPRPIGVPLSQNERPTNSVLSVYFLPSMVLLFGFLVLVVFIFSERFRQTRSVEGQIKIETIVIITIGIMFIISLGNQKAFYDNITQLYAPAFGLLGTMAGYIFGRSSVERPEPKKETDDAPPK